MNLRLMILDKFVPSFIKTARIKELFITTAAAFEVALPDLYGIKYPALLEEYVHFAKNESDKILNNEQRTAEIRSRLYKSAVETGLLLKDELRIKNFEEVLVASRIFYRILGIEFSGDAGGKITISQCLFSRYFSAKHCALFSALDEGVAEGLSNGQLRFTQRITDNKECCKAIINFTQ